MSSNVRLITIRTVSPLHIGAGQGTAAIDSPILRDAITQIPYIPATSLKGAIRGTYRDAAQPKNPHARQQTDCLFGALVEHDRGTREAGDAGALMFGDARLLLFPVRSFAGIFAWVTSPLLINRFLQDLQERQESPNNLIQRCSELTRDQCWVPQQSMLFHKPDNVIIHDYHMVSINQQSAKSLQAIYEQLKKNLSTVMSAEELDQHICIVSDEILIRLVKTCTEVNAHIRIDPETGTVGEGALWYEESLPADTVLTSVVIGQIVAQGAKREQQKSLLHAFLQTQATTQTIAMGGRLSVGAGLCQIAWK